jgi:hypothetical protein
VDKLDKNRTPQRDGKGRFVPGTPSPAVSPGRPPIIRHVRELALQHTEKAIEMLAEIAADKGQHGSARVAAIKEILDRGVGKVTQPIDTALSGELAIRWMSEADRHDSGESSD